MINYKIYIIDYGEYMWRLVQINPTNYTVALDYDIGNALLIKLNLY